MGIKAPHAGMLTLPRKFAGTHFYSAAPGFSKALKSAWRAQFGSECPRCGQPMLFSRDAKRDLRFATIDHIVSRLRGGSNALHNLRLLCRGCNEHLGRAQLKGAARKHLTAGAVGTPVRAQV